MTTAARRERDLARKLTVTLQLCLIASACASTAQEGAHQPEDADDPDADEVRPGLLDEPGIAIRARKLDERVVFEFRYCSGEAVRAINWISVSDEAEARCELRRDNSREPLVAWEYGTTPTGFTLPSCRPLEPGRSYEIYVRGGGGGFQGFRVEGNSEVTTLRGFCKYPEGADEQQ
jgi:hypothetical protein